MPRTGRPRRPAIDDCVLQTLAQLVRAETASSRDALILQLEEQLRGGGAADDGLLTNDETLDPSVEELRAVNEELKSKIEELRQVSARAADEHTRRFASFPELNPNPVLEVSPSGEVTFANPATGRVLGELGLDPGDPRPLLPPDLDGVFSELTACGTASLRREIVLKDRVFEQSIHLATPFHVVRIYFQDVTERRRAELERERLLAEVQQGAAELDAVFQALPFLVSVHDREGRYVRVNPTMVNFLGFDPTRASREEIARRVKACFLDGRALTPENMPSSRALRGEAVGDVEYAITDARGEQRVLRFNAVPLKADGEVRGAVFAQQDVTERKRTEEALRRSEATLRGVLDATKESIWLFDLDGTILLGNETALQRSGRPADEVIGRTLEELLSAALAQGRMARLRQVVESGASIQFEDERAGMHFVHSFYPVFDEAGRVVRVASFSRDVTAQKQAEDALRSRAVELEAARAEAEREKGLLEAVMAALPVGACITDVRGGVLQANAAFEQLWKGPLPATRSVDDYDAYRAWWVETGEPLAPEEWASAQAVRKGVPVVGQFLEIQRFDGSRATVLNSAAPVRDAAGRVVGSAIALQDLTELRRAEDALRESEERFRRLFEGHKAVMLLIEPQSGAIVDANVAAAGFYGRSRDELRRMTIREINLLPTEEVAAERQKAVEEQRNYFVFPHRLADGRTRWVEVYSTPVEVKGATLLFSVIHDVTERRQVEQALHESEQRLRFHVENSPMAVVEWDADFVVTRWAGEAERMFGWAEAEVIGRPLSDLHMIVEEDLPIVDGVVARLTDGVTRRVVSANRNVTKDGRVVHCEWYNSVLFGADGCMTSVLSLVLDVTERERYERELLAAREAAEAATRAKSDFLAVMSHEIRTPMNGILGMAELLAGTSLESRQREYVWGIRTSGELLLSILNDILDFSKIEAGGLELERAPFELATAVGDTVHLEAEPASQKGLGLCCELGAGLPGWVEGDRTRLQQVLLNLIGNAIKFTRAGQVVVRVDLLEEVEGRAVVRFTVSDTGIGIPEDAQARLFEPFAQAEASTTRRYGGTGLGLTICRRLVEAMGGRIGFESRKGAGSAFWFTVPLSPVSETEPSRGASTTPGEGRAAGPEPTPGPSTSKRGRVLLAEDNPVNQAVGAGMLDRLGFDVDLVEDGAAAVDAAFKGPYDAVFLDWRMPIMDGLEAAREIRRRETGTRRNFLVAVTANATARDRQQCLDAGMDDHLPKPLNIEALEAVLTRAGAARSLREKEAPTGETLSSFQERVRKLARSLPPERVPTIFTSFVEDAYLKIEQLRVAARRKDAAAVSFLAHGLRGSCALFGTDRMVELSRALEAEASSGTLEEKESLIGELEEETDRVSRFLKSGGLRATVSS